MVLLRSLLLALLLSSGWGAQAADTGPVSFQRTSQFIAALGAPGAKAGGGAQAWGLWTVDPGPRGVSLGRHAQLVAANGVAPDGWRFEANDWWLEENGLIMESPRFALPPGRYLVTGFRDVTSVLTVHPADAQGEARWELADDATLHDVTHLGCRSARYTPAPGGGACSPARANREDFPIDEGSTMPDVPGCARQDYAVLIVIGVARPAVPATR